MTGRGGAAEPSSTEAIDPRYADLDILGTGALLAELIGANQRAVEAVRRALPELERAAGAMRERLSAGGRLAYLGAGTSGRLAAQDAAELEPTFGFGRIVILLAGGELAGTHAREGAEDDEEAGGDAVERAALGGDDVLVGVAASGRTPFTVAGVRRARERGALTVGIANNPGTPLLAVAEHAIFLDSGPEVLAGSTRLVAGTAQKIALNALSTAVMIRLGGAYRNLMVGMEPTNSKLRKRAIGMVAIATGASEVAASQALERSHWRIREAIVCLLTGLDPSAAQEALRRHGNQVRAAITGAQGERGPE